MTPREEIEATYKVVNGRITSPGQFEGEMVYVPFYWNAYLDGGADSDDGEVLTFEITPEERHQFPELANRRTIRIYQRDDGFVCEQ